MLKETMIAYLKTRLKIIVFFCLVILIFTLVYFLYGFPLDPILYGSFLNLILGIMIGSIDFIFYYQKHLQLSQVIKNSDVESSHLPLAKDLLEKDYQEFIINLFRERIALISKYDHKQEELLDYYKLWVHQIKTPISAMSLILQSDENFQEKTLLKQELFKIEQYVAMVLQYLRIDSMSSDLILKNYDLFSLVNQAVKNYALIFINKKISLNLETLNATVLTDEKWLVFVLEQILSNALKYSNKGEISIYMDVSEKKTLVIEDHGLGIQPEDIKRIFEKGFTGYNGRLDKKSTGIGLYLSEQVLKKLSHPISITSKLGSGTKVKIDLSQEPLELI